MDIREALGLGESKEQQQIKELYVDIDDLTRRLQAANDSLYDVRQENERLQAENTKLHADVDRDVETMDGYSQTITELREDKRRRDLAEPLLRPLADEIAAQEADGKLDFEAAALAKDIVAQRIHNQTVGNIAQMLLDEYEDEIRAQHTPAIMQKIKDEQREVFEMDGTKDRVKAETHTDIVLGARGEVIEAERQRLAKWYGSPAVRAAMVAEETAALKSEEKFEELEQEMRTDQKPEWRRLAVEGAKQEISAAIEAERAAYVRSYEEDWVNTYDGQRYRERIEQELRRGWEQAAIEKVSAAIENEELRELLAEKAADAIKQLAKEAITRNHLDHFLKGGMDTTIIPADSEVIIQMGEVKPELNRQSYGQSAPQFVDCERELSVTANGDNTFTVNYDTLADQIADNPYVLNDVLKINDVITIGRGIRIKGKPHLSPRLKKGVPLAFDPTPDTPDTFSDGYIKVINVIVDGVSALTDVHKVRMPDGSEHEI